MTLSPYLKGGACAHHRTGVAQVRLDMPQGDLGLEESALDCHGSRLSARVDVQLVEDCGGMLGDRSFGDEELAADRFAGEALGHQPQHLPLAFCERAFAARSWDGFGVRLRHGDYLQ